MDNTPDKFFAAIGEGVLDWPTIFSQEKQAGMQYFFVEQDRTVPGKDPFDEIAISHKYLEGMRY
jgi:sugar phosphate isomerase/epimerase